MFLGFGGTSRCPRKLGASVENAYKPSILLYPLQVQSKHSIYLISTSHGVRCDFEVLENGENHVKSGHVEVPNHYSRRDNTICNELNAGAAFLFSASRVRAFHPGHVNSSTRHSRQTEIYCTAGGCFTHDERKVWSTIIGYACRGVFFPGEQR